MSNERNLFRPECAGASREWHEKCPRCGARRQDNCDDDEAFEAQLAQRNEKSTSKPTPIMDPGWRPINDDASNGKMWLLYENGHVWSDKWNAEFEWWDIASEAEPTHYAPMLQTPEGE